MPHQFSSAAFRRGARDAIGVPAGVLAASYIGFGALASAGGISIWVVIVSTITIWALPGQLVMVDMWQFGAPMIAIVLAVTLANARFLPMAITLLPVIRDPDQPRWYYYIAAHGVAMTSWVISMRRCPEMPVAERMAYFAGFSFACIVVSAVAGAVGYLLADSIPATIRIGLVFLAPVYFFVFLVGEARSRLARIALACGGLAGPLCYVLTPQWSVLAAGFVGGTAAFALNKSLERNVG